MFNRRFQHAEERISKRGDRVIEITQFAVQKGKRIKKNEQGTLMPKEMGGNPK